MPATTATPPGRQLTPWLLLLLALAVLAAGLGYDRYDAYRNLDAQERQRLVDEANVTKKNLSARLQTTSNALAALRSDLPWLLAHPEGLTHLNSRLATVVASTEGLRSLLVVDGNGTATASNRQELVGINFRDQERYRTMSRDANPDILYVSAPFKTPLGIWTISLGRVILDDQGRFNGYLLAILDPDYFRLLINSTLYAPDMRVSLIHGEGKVVFRAPDPEGLTGQDVLAQPHSFFRRIRDSGAEQLVLEGPTAAPGGARLAALQAIRPRETIADQPLVVITSRDLAAVLAPWWQETRVRLALFGLIALVAAIGLGAYQRRQRAYSLLRAAEEAKREEVEARLRLAVEGAELGLWYWDLATNRLEWSDRCKAHLALPADQAPSFEHFYAVIHPEDRARVEDLLRAAVATGERYAAEYRVMHADGTEHWLNAPGRVYRAADGTPIGMGGVTQDITARKQTEANLQASERRFRQLFEHLPIAYQSVDSAGRWLDANQKLADLLGFASPEEMIGQSFVDYWDESIRDQFDANYARFKANLSIDGEVPLRRRDGTPLTVLFAGRIQDDDQGRFLRTHCILIDITERRAMEDQIRALNEDLERKVAQRTAELSRSEARARAFMHTALDAVVVIDKKSCILEFNQAAETLFGYPAEEILGQPLETLMAPEDAGRHRLYLAASTGQGARLMGGNRQILARHRSGRDFPVEISVGSLLEGDQRLHVGIIRDVSERMRFEAALEDARKTAEAASAAKSEFLAHMSHEIRTPLNGVLGLVQLLQREPLTPDQRDMVTRIQGAGQSLLAILNDILDFSKIEAGQLRLEDRPFRLDALPAKLDSLLGSVARGKGLALRIEGPDADLGPLRGDALRLEQVLINLVGNAIKFTERGEVAVTFTTLASDPTGVRVRCTVRDSGIGIGPEALGRLFTPFTQADASTTRRFGGTGLGLAICKRLVELMGGTLGADSVPGAGSTFWFELPFRHATDEEVPAPAAPVAALPLGPRLPGLHLLAVDDSAMNRDLVEMALSREGAQVTLAADGQQAVQLLRASPAGFDAVLMDVQMPVMDGRTATRLIRQELGLTQLPVIALTAGVLAEEQRLIREAGADDVLAKPLDLGLLVATLLRLIPAGRLSAGHQASPAMVADAASLAGTLPVPLAGMGPPSATPEAASPDAFPLIPGIDPDRAALITGHDPAFFRAQLARLLRESAGVGAACRQALAQGDRETAARRLHSLKGNAGNLGALDLMRAAGDLEGAIGQGTADLDAGLAALDHQLQDLAAASAPWLAVAPATDQVRADVGAVAPGGALASSSASGPSPLDPARLTVLREALGDHDLAASDHFGELEAALTAAWGPEAVQTLGQAIADLRFGEALALLDRQTPGTAD